ncbi:SseB family protein [Kocuria coralli]|uniref:SseB family protein n=1 Tax=Kocuria coralli TaxID=1461025 RepID=A0A5J5L0B2_9MICC|nr:SseB family protein [Kocuria coralli]KAA9395263.1 SseB family protein [Kocuria coralli]
MTTQEEREPGLSPLERAGTHVAARLSDEHLAEALRDELRSVGNWILGVLNAQPGWDLMKVDLKPQGGRTWLRITEHRADRAVPGTVGPIKPGSPILRRINRLQSLSYRPGRGTWLSTTITVSAEGWPEPSYSFTASHNFDDRPPVLGEEGPYQVGDALEHLEVFPRTEARVPEWLAEMAGEADLPVHVLPPDAEDEAAPAGTVNPRLREAVAGFSASPSEEAMIEVLRQCTAGNLIVDASGSDLVRGTDGQITPDSTIRLQSFAESDGTRSLAAYTAETEARAMFERSGQEGEAVLLRRPAVAVLELVAADEQYDHLVLDAGGASCRIPRRQIEWLLSSPRNDVAKNGLVLGSVPQVLSGMVGADSSLLLGVRALPEASGPQDVEPVWARPEEGQEADTLLLFTSAAEVAALDPTLEIRAAAARDVLRYALGTGAAHVCLNARPPVASFSMEDIREVLLSVEDGADEGPAGSGGQGQGLGDPSDPLNDPLNLSDGSPGAADPATIDPGDFSR